MSLEPRAARILDGIALALLLATVFLAPLPIGSEAPWAQSAVFIAVAAAAALWIVAGVARGSLHVPRSIALLFIAAFFVVGLLQVVPLSQNALGVISPNAKAMRAQALGAEGVAGTATISLNPYATKAALFRYGASAIVFVLLASLVRSRKTIAWTVSALLAAGLFQVVYAMAEHASGGANVFWVRKTVYAPGFTGTFFNKNHFAGFIELLLPLAAALILTVRESDLARRAETAVQKIVLLIGAPEVQKRIILSIPAVLLAVGVALSLSRSGVVCSLVALSALVVLAVTRVGRGRSRVLLPLLIALVCVVLAVASGPLIDKFQTAFTGRRYSMSARLDMLRSASSLVRDFPVLGTGLGTTEHVFGAYQSQNLGNVHVGYLANDWAQIACEAGLVGLLLVAAGLVLFVGSTLRTAVQRRGRFHKWVAIGALAGVFAMMLHSFTDFNLVRTLSNGLLFAALLALAHSAAHSQKESAKGVESSGHTALRLGPWPLRFVLGLAVAVPLCMLAADRVRAARADICFNRYLHYAGSYDGRTKHTGLYYFLPLPDLPADPRKSASGELAKALELVPLNPLYRHATGREQMAEIDRRVGRLAETMAGRALPGTKEKDPDGFPKVVEIFRRPAQEELGPEIIREGLLPGAEEAFRAAVRLAPTVPRYHLSLGGCLALRTRIELKRDPAAGAWEVTRRQARTELDRAAYFGHNVPYILFDAAQLILTYAADFGGREGDRDTATATELLRRAIYAAPGQLAIKGYTLLRSVGTDSKGLFAATPDTVRAYRYLCKFLWARRDWDSVLSALDKLDGLVAEVRPDVADPAVAAKAEAELRDEPSERAEAVPPRFAWASEDAPTVVLQQDIVEKRAFVLGLLGRWDERNRALETHADLVDRSADAAIERAGALFEQGNFDQAMREYQQALTRAPHNIAGLIGMATATSVPFVRESAPVLYGPIDCLFRLVTNNPSLTTKQSDKIVSMLREMKPSSDDDKVAAEFTECVAVLLRSAAGPSSESRTVALKRLDKLAHDRAAKAWPARHLIWYYLGMAYEAKGDLGKAVEMYDNVRVRTLVLDHRRSLERLADLANREADKTVAKRYEAKLAALRPEHPCAVTFGGALRLLGYSIDRPPAGETEAGSIRYFWEFLGRVPRNYGAYTYFLGENWRVLRVDGGRALASVGRYGEVVVEKRPLPKGLAGVKYIGVTLYAPDPPRGWERHLPRNGGRGLARFKLVRPKVPQP